MYLDTINNRLNGNTAPSGEVLERVGYFAELGLEDYDARVVRPHERTLAGPKADRLKILRAAEANLSAATAAIALFFGIELEVRLTSVAIEPGKDFTQAIEGEVERTEKLIAAIRGVPTGVNLPSPPTHQTKYSIEESVAKMIQSMYMAWGFRVPVYPKISGTSTALAVLNNLTRNPYAAGLAIDGEDGSVDGKVDGPVV